MSPKWIPNQCVRSSNEAELGLGYILRIDAQIIEVAFPKSAEKRLYSLKSAPLERMAFSVGAEISLRTGQNLKINEVKLENGLYSYITDSGIILEKEIVGAKQVSHPLDCLRDGRISSFNAFELRKKALLQLKSYNESRVHGIIGSRVTLTPHQLYAVNKIVSMPYPRALLADEVGLGKTIEAALIFSKLKALGRAKKVLILVPEALKHQWLAELYRKFLELFTLVDEERWTEEIKSQGSNSFAANSFILASLDLLLKEKESLESALKENWDLVIVDEAHQLALLEKNAPDTLKFFLKLSETSKSILFLTATPYRFGEENFDFLVNLLKTSYDYPIEYIHNRRDVIKGFPKRVLRVCEIENNTNSKMNWLLDFTKNNAIEKLLLIVSSEEKATEIFKTLTEKTGYKTALFTESMDLVQRDKQAAWFAAPEGARILVCSEMGSEGRNFQFCHDLILMDLPENPDILEQRIGRLDRIGQSEDVKIHVPFIKGSQDEFYLKLYREIYKIFEKPCPFSFRIYDRLNDKITPETISLSKSWVVFEETANKVYDEEEKNYLKKIQKSVDEKSFHAEKAAEFLKEIQKFENNKNSDSLFEDLMEHFGIVHDDFGIHRTIKLGSESLMFVEDFPHLGSFEEKAVTFDRGVALLREDIEFLTLEHPLYQSSLDYFFNQESGIAGLSFCKEIPSKSLLIECFFKEEESVFINQRGDLLPKQTLNPLKDRKLNAQDAQKLYSLYGEDLTRLIKKASEAIFKKFPNSKLDSIHIFIGI